MSEIVIDAEILSDKVGRIVITLNSGEKLHGTTRGIHPDEDDDGVYHGHRLLFDADELNGPIFLKNKDISSIEKA